MVGHRPDSVERRSWDQLRRIAAGIAIEQLQARGAVIVGVQGAGRDDATLGVDFDDLKDLDLEGWPLLTIGGARMIERQPVTRRGQHRARRLRSRPGDELEIGNVQVPTVAMMTLARSACLPHAYPNLPAVRRSRASHNSKLLNSLSGPGGT